MNGKQHRVKEYKTFFEFSSNVAELVSLSQGPNLYQSKKEEIRFK